MAKLQIFFVPIFCQFPECSIKKKKRQDLVSDVMSNCSELLNDIWGKQGLQAICGFKLDLPNAT